MTVCKLYLNKLASTNDVRRGSWPAWGTLLNQVLPQLGTREKPEEGPLSRVLWSPGCDPPRPSPLTFPTSHFTGDTRREPTTQGVPEAAVCP